jgi:hypothetical protein
MVSDTGLDEAAKRCSVKNISYMFEKWAPWGPFSISPKAIHE